jgi:hypothetical protein
MCNPAFLRSLLRGKKRWAMAGVVKGQGSSSQGNSLLIFGLHRYLKHARVAIHQYQGEALMRTGGYSVRKPEVRHKRLKYSIDMLRLCVIITSIRCTGGGWRKPSGPCGPFLLPIRTSCRIFSHLVGSTSFGVSLPPYQQNFLVLCRAIPVPLKSHFGSGGR